MKVENEMSRQSGFTLIELMIVVAIIGILTAVAVPAYRDYIATSHGAAAMKSIAGFVMKAQGCIQADNSCSSLVSEVAAIAELSSSPDPILPDVAADLTWDDGTCSVTVSIAANGPITYSAKSTGGGATDAQCEAGAGI